MKILLDHCVMLHQMIGYVKCFDSNKTISFKVNDNNLLERYTKYGKKLAVSWI